MTHKEFLQELYWAPVNWVLDEGLIRSEKKLRGEYLCPITVVVWQRSGLRLPFDALIPSDLYKGSELQKDITKEVSRFLGIRKIKVEHIIIASNNEIGHKPEIRKDLLKATRLTEKS